MHRDNHQEKLGPTSAWSRPPSNSGSLHRTGHAQNHTQRAENGDERVAKAPCCSDRFARSASTVVFTRRYGRLEHIAGGEGSNTAGRATDTPLGHNCIISFVRMHTACGHSLPCSVPTYEKTNTLTNNLQQRPANKSQSPENDLHGPRRHPNELRDLLRLELLCRPSGDSRHPEPRPEFWLTNRLRPRQHL